MVSQEGGQFHVDAQIFVSQSVFKGFKAGIGGHDQLVFGSIQRSRFNGTGAAIPKVLVEDLVKGPIRLKFGNKKVDLVQELGLGFINTKGIGFIGQGEVDTLDLALLLAGAAGHYGHTHKYEDKQG